MEKFLPVYIRSSRLKCLVVGGGKVATRKVKTLLKNGIKPVIIAPEIDEELKELIAVNELQYHSRIYAEHDARGFNMVFGATSSVAVNRLIKNELDNWVLFNDVSSAQMSDFLIPYIVDRGAIKITVSSNGDVPFLAKEIGLFIDNQLPVLDSKKMERLVKKRSEIIYESETDSELKASRLKNELTPLINDLLNRSV